MNTCPHCGASVAPEMKYCPYCATSIAVEVHSNEPVSAQDEPQKEPQITSMSKPDDNLGFAIFAFVFTPFGIPALINATRVDEYWYSGQYDKAENAAKMAKKWSKISLIAGCALWALVILFYYLSYMSILIAALVDGGL